eukprot:jgi/Psemu1/312932/fgenesh1_kg.1059_\
MYAGSAHIHVISRNGAPTKYYLFQVIPLHNARLVKGTDFSAILSFPRCSGTTASLDSVT